MSLFLLQVGAIWIGNAPSKKKKNSNLKAGRCVARICSPDHFQDYKASLGKGWDDVQDYLVEVAPGVDAVSRPTAV